jgi:phosphatidylethanolamine/phosphatidyl-N-methylethanolamine N-methyltransferase
MLADLPVYFSQWLRDPLGIGSLLPTNPLVGRTAARWLSLDRPGAIVELGGGIGSVTRGLLQAGCPPERLVVIEREPQFVRILERRFPRVRVLAGDAADLMSLLQRAGVDRLAGVLSCLPIKWFPLALQSAVVNQGFELLDPRACLLQLTNAGTSPLPMAPLGLAGEPVAHVWLNFLPIRIWRYTRPRGAGLRTEASTAAA